MANNLQPNKTEKDIDYTKEGEYCYQFLKDFEDPDMEPDSKYGRNRYLKELVRFSKRSKK
jgi:hypothetical protein